MGSDIEKHLILGQELLAPIDEAGFKEPELGVVVDIDLWENIV
jgi:hypothetical protein